jgi:hypothetical protein
MMLIQVFYQTSQQLKIRKTFTPTIGSSTRYDIYFRNGIFNPHTGHKSGQVV